MIKLPRHTPEFPRATATDVNANAWGDQWRFLPRALRQLTRRAGQLYKGRDA